MYKALSLGKISAVGSLQLFIGKLASIIILAVGTILIALFISESDYGLFTIALIPATTLLLFHDLGVGSAMTRYIAQNRSLGKNQELRRIMVVGLAFTVAVGLALTVGLVLTANFIATTVFGRPESAFLISFAALVIISSSLFGVAQSIFVGFEEMKVNTATMVCAAVFQSTFVPILVYLGYGAGGAVVGYTVSSIVSSLVAMALLFFTIYRKQPPILGKLEIKKTLKPLINYGFPLAAAGILSGLTLSFYSFLMASYCNEVQIGNFRVAGNFGTLLTLIIFPISTVLFPAFSKLNPKEHKIVKLVFGSSVKYGSLLLVPATFAMFVLSGPLIGTLYGDKWAYAPTYLALVASGNLLVILGSISVGILFSAMGQTRLLLKMNALALGIGFVLGFFLVPNFGMVGAIIGPIVSTIPTIVIGLYLATKRYDVNVNLRCSLKILLVSAIAAAIAYFAITYIVAQDILLLVIGASLFVLTYLVLSPVIGAINRIDIVNIRAMFSSLGLFSKLLNIPLVCMDKIACIRNRSKQISIADQELLQSIEP